MNDKLIVRECPILIILRANLGTQVTNNQSKAGASKSFSAFPC